MATGLYCCIAIIATGLWIATRISTTSAPRCLLLLCSFNLSYLLLSSSLLLCGLLCGSGFFLDSFIFFKLGNLILCQMLHLIVCHDTRVVTESYMAWSNYCGVDLSLLSQVNLMVGAHCLDLRCINLDEQFLVISGILALNMAQIVSVVRGDKVPPKDHSIFARGDDLVLTHLLCQVMLGQAALRSLPSEQVNDAIFTTLVKSA